MVTLRHIFLRPFWLLGFLCSGCTIFPQQSDRHAPVEDRSLPTEQPSTRIESTVKTFPAHEPGPVPVPEQLPDQIGIKAPVQTPDEQKSGPAVVALLDDADQYTASGKRDQAVASLERALRIEPKNPLLWNRLGLLRLQQGIWDQAIALATKSNVLAAGNNVLQSDNWLIIAKAREATGDKDGALQALDMMQQLRN